MRGVYGVAGFHGAPALEPTAEAQYWVTPIDPKTPEDKAESHLREYNKWVLKWLTIHEALPGHYIQAEHANRIEPESRKLVRTVFGSGTYAEGWAEYISDVMTEAGFASGDPRYLISRAKIRLRVMTNAILDVRMHTLGMTDEEALSLMKGEAFQTDAEAEGKLQRAKLTACQLPTYYVGTKGWWALRKKYEAAAGASFDLRVFHDRALDAGELPLPLLEGLLLPSTPRP
jgi:uncharacterized protein (DUF885 family)